MKLTCVSFKIGTSEYTLDVVQDRYLEFLWVARVWRYLTSVRQSGQAHNIDSILTHRNPGSLAVCCPACPEIGFNVSQEFLDVLSPDMRLVVSYSIITQL